MASATRMVAVRVGDGEEPDHRSMQGQVGPGAKNAGLDLNDTVGVLAAFDNAGIKGSDAGTSLKTMLTRLVPRLWANAYVQQLLLDSRGPEAVRGVIQAPGARRTVQ
mgnify:CR=1 FL=1